MSIILKISDAASKFWQLPKSFSTYLLLIVLYLGATLFALTNHGLTFGMLIRGNGNLLTAGSLIFMIFALVILPSVALLLQCVNLKPVAVKKIFGAMQYLPCSVFQSFKFSVFALVLNPRLFYSPEKGKNTLGQSSIFTSAENAWHEKYGTKRKTLENANNNLHESLIGNER